MQVKKINSENVGKIRALEDGKSGQVLQEYYLLSLQYYY